MKRNQMIDRELQNHPHVQYDYEMRGKHPSVVLKVGGRQKFVVFTSTKTDYRGERNKICEIRRAIREISV
jgi:hypothetical protein